MDNYWKEQSESLSSTSKLVFVLTVNGEPISVYRERPDEKLIADHLKHFSKEGTYVITELDYFKN